MVAIIVSKISDLKGNTGYGEYQVLQPSPSLEILQTPTEAMAVPTKANPILQSGDRFGNQVALDGSYLAVGVPDDRGYSGPRTGAVYIFKKTSSTWNLEQKISDSKIWFHEFEERRPFWSLAGS